MFEDKKVQGQSPNIGSYAVLRSIAADIIKFSVVAYAIGFLIVNSSLLEYGYMSFDISSTRYLIAGLLFISVSALILLASSICRRLAKINRKILIYGIGLYSLVFTLHVLLGIEYTRKNVLYEPRWLFSIVFLLSMLVPISSFFISSLCRSKKLRPIVEIFLVAIPFLFLVLYGSKEILYLVLFVVLVFGYEDIILLKSDAIKKEVDLNNLDTPKFIAWRIIGLLALPIMFGTQIYSKVDRMRGGGAPLRATVLIQTEYEDIIKRNDHEFVIDFNNARLILESDRSIFIGIETRDGKKAALEIPKGNIVSIRYLKTKTVPVRKGDKSHDRRPPAKRTTAKSGSESKSSHLG